MLSIGSPRSSTGLEIVSRNTTIPGTMTCTSAVTLARVFHDVRDWRRPVVDGSPVVMMPRCPERLRWRLRLRRRIDRDRRVRESRGLGGPSDTDRLAGVISPRGRIEHGRERTAHGRIDVAGLCNPEIALGFD